MFSRSKPEPVTKPQPAAGTPSRGGGKHPPSILSGSLKVVGDLQSTGDIQLDGEVEGDIRSHKVTIGETAVVNGAVVADHVRIAGTVDGEITGREVALTSTARVSGDIYHDSLSIEAGAHMQGLCRRVEDIDARINGQPKTAPATSAPPGKVENADKAENKADDMSGGKTETGASVPSA